MDDDDDILAVAEAAAELGSLGVGPDSAEARLQRAIATAVMHGKPVRQVAAVAHMTALEVVDAAEAVTYQASLNPPLTPPLTSEAQSSGSHHRPLRQESSDYSIRG